LAGEPAAHEIDGGEFSPSNPSNIVIPLHSRPVPRQHAATVLVFFYLPLTDHTRPVKSKVEPADPGEHAAVGHGVCRLSGRFGQFTQCGRSVTPLTSSPQPHQHGTVKPRPGPVFVGSPGLRPGFLLAGGEAAACSVGLGGNWGALPPPSFLTVRSYASLAFFWRNRALFVKRVPPLADRRCTPRPAGGTHRSHRLG